jgi:hypothetical protein
LQIGSLQKEAGGISLSYPFEILRHSIPLWYIPISFLFSFTFPIVTIVKYREIMTDKPFVFAFILTIFGIITGAFLKETGPRVFDGNLMWQNIICTYLLFLTTVSFLLKKSKTVDSKLRGNKLLWGIFYLHTISGFIYLIKFLIVGNGA